MKKLNLPVNNKAIDELKQAFNYQDGSPKYIITDDEIEIIRTLYNKYEVLKGLPSDDFKSINLTPQINDSILSSYQEIQEKGRLKDLRSRLLLATTRCPFCGISSPDELDHHLPKTIFKALSLYSSNLVPMCHTCNNKKRTVTGEKEEERFIHVYYEDLPDTAIIKAITSFKDKKLSIEFEMDLSSLPILKAKQLSFQFERINLNFRLKKEVNVYLFSMIEALKDAYGIDKNISRVKDFLSRQALSNSKAFGINDWRAILLYSLSECDEFCDNGFEDYFMNS